MPKPEGQICIITGWPGTGKTTLCRAVIEAARRKNWDIAGILSLAIFSDGHKTGIEVFDLRSEQSKLLARWIEGKTCDKHNIPWDFDEAALQWGNERLKSAVPCQLLVVDELGFLEFDMGQGWLSGFDAIESRQYKLAMTTIRPGLLEKAMKRWPDALVYSVGDDPGALKHLTDRFF